MVMVESSAQEGCFNVVEFGAVGDGETDDSEVKNKNKNYSYTLMPSHVHNLIGDSVHVMYISMHIKAGRSHKF